ncbi:uncharacterized protein EI90DRAFT_3017437 [Cantharellus anzutake]|uniref:uncharacterized protein n=1 Tax=Cantharellus anzutake TaxID=1750568 RepID=UPI0019076750|nr:uncharacterized protein EI90DRAFT_3017437 [Cantharellus anzutake]KAF8328813.1 hypothetical protein EI90DRAFT_3017437 [Cantharellus anzutake]
MSEVCQDIGANPGSPNVPTRDRGSGMGVAKVRCAATRLELRQSGGKVTWRVGRHGVGDGEVVRKVNPNTDIMLNKPELLNMNPNFHSQEQLILAAVFTQMHVQCNRAVGASGNA